MGYERTPTSRRCHIWIGLVLLTVLAQTAPAAELQFAGIDAAVGQVRIGTALAHDFAFTAAGTEAIEIVDLRASCGCLTPHLAKRLYQPGEHGTLRLEVNTLTQPTGLQSWHLQVSYRAGDQVREATLRLRAQMVQEIAVQPAALMFVGDRTLTHTITITDPRVHPLMVTDVRSSTPGLVVAARRNARDSRQTIIDVRMSCDDPAGRHDEIVSIYTNDLAYRELRVPVTIERRPRQRVVVRPPEISLVAPPGQPVPSQVLLLRDRDNQAVVIDSIRADDPAVTARWARGPGSMATVRVLVERHRLHRPTLKTLIHIRLQQPETEELVLPVSCRVE